MVAVTACSGDSDPVLADGQAPKPDARTLRCTQQFGDAAASPYRLPYPVGRTYRVIQSYCPPNPAWGHHNWLAYDFDLQIGDTVLASRAGRVFAARDGFDDGTRRCGEENWVFVEHDDRSAMQYVHLTRGGLLVQEGDEVTQGQPIALSGDSGCSSGPHLHVTLFGDRSGFGAENTIPLNYNNASGALDVRNGLVEGRPYTAEP
ncbi:MAG TPA: M23 family metallopeptidase [Longimicrobiales bacterium]|nr:M23 family metallopeptidase [Longimicrobiales bacterium]